MYYLNAVITYFSCLASRYVYLFVHRHDAELETLSKRKEEKKPISTKFL